MTGAQIFEKLLKFNLNYQEFDWLANQGLSDFELLVSVILTQNTNWKNVLKALENLRQENITHIEQINNLSDLRLASLIKPSGFYNTKAKRLKNLIQKILNTYENWDDFKTNVDRKWLLDIKGLGFESADSVLNYLCKREILVVDSYSMRLALNLGYEFEHYEELREFLQSDIKNKQDNLCKIINKKCPLYELYQIFHALIVAFAKESFKGMRLSLQGEQYIRKLKEIL